MALMTEKRCRQLPVVEDGRGIGALSIADRVEPAIAGPQRAIVQLESCIMS